MAKDIVPLRLPDGPIFVPPPSGRESGVDFLGLRQVSLSLASKFLPGLNNVTSHVRPYSLMCWAAKTFKDRCGVSLDDANPKRARELKEALEVLLAWSHMASGVTRGYVGSRSKKPKGNRVQLTFSAWRRKSSYMQAVYYGPSLAGDDGLELLQRIKPDVYQCTASGLQLAQAFEAALAKRGVLSRLKCPLGYADEALAKRLFPVVQIDAPSPGEAAVLQRAFFDENKLRTMGSLGPRTVALLLVKAYLKRHRRSGLYPTELRREMALDFRPAAPQFEPALHEAQAKWAVLQVRQAQRLALELIFSWCERHIYYSNGQSSQDLARALYTVLTESHKRPEAFLDVRLTAIARRVGGGRDIFLAARQHEQLDIVTLAADLAEKIRKEKNVSDESAREAFSLLALCVPFAQALFQDQVAKVWLGEGPFRLPLNYVSAWLESARQVPFLQVLSRIVELWIIAQHLQTATLRADEERQNLRIWPEEAGLMCLVSSSNDLWIPNISPDRLVSALSLAAECGVLSVGTNGRYLFK